MYLLDQIKYLRESILDDVGGTGVVWQNVHESEAEASQLRWTNEELAFNLTQAEREVARRAKILKDTSGDYDITTTADVMQYDLDPKVLRILHAQIGPYALQQKEIEDIWGIYDWKGLRGEPKYFVPDHSNRSVSLFRTPDDIYTVELMVYRLPKIDLNWELADTQSPEIPEMHHFPMINYAAYLCYMKDEANALDPTRVGQFKTLFDADYPEDSWASEVRKKRNGRRTVRYGGL